jgi:hypothetical protein
LFSKSKNNELKTVKLKVYKKLSHSFILDVIPYGFLGSPDGAYRHFFKITTVLRSAGMFAAAMGMWFPDWAGCGFSG